MMLLNIFSYLNENINKLESKFPFPSKVQTTNPKSQIQKSVTIYSKGRVHFKKRKNMIENFHLKLEESLKRARR